MTAVQVLVAVIYCLLAAGIVFGYAAIKPILKKEGAYQDMCSSAAASRALSPVSSGYELFLEATTHEMNTCIEIHLNFMFTCAAVATNVWALPLGTLLDRYGPRFCGVLGSFFLAIGAVLMAYARKLPFDGFLVGYVTLALGGPSVFISSFQLSNAFPRKSGLVLALLTGAFDASSALFLGYRLIYDVTDGRFGHHKFFFSYLSVPVFVFAMQFLLLPAQSYKTVGQLVETVEEAEAAINSDRSPYDDQIDEQTALLREERQAHQESIIADVEQVLGSTNVQAKAEKEERKNEASGVWGAMHGATAGEQVRSLWFVLICLFTVIQMTRINYFVATVRPQYEAILGSHEKAIQINNFFDIALPLGGLLSIPFIGVFLDHTSTPAVLATLVTTATCIGVLGVLPYMWAAYANVTLFVLYRPFYYTTVSDYTAKVFGFETFGTVYGTIICLSGLFNFSQSGLDFLFHKTFHGNPMPVNIMLLSTGALLGVALVSYVGWQARNMKRKMLEREAEAAFRRQ